MRSTWRLGTWRGIPITVHWTVLLGLPWLYFLTRSASGTVVGFVGLFALLLVHEMGHALVAMWREVPVGKIQLFLLHGSCTHEEPYYEEDDVLIAWGGVAAQLAVLVVALGAEVILADFSPAASRWFSPLAHVLVQTNLFIIAINLIPVAPFDGAKAWRALPLLRERAQQTAWASRVRNILAARRRSRDRKLEAKAARVADDIIEQLKKRKPERGDGA